MEQKSHGNNSSTLIRYWLPNKTFKVAGGCYSDVGSSSISMSLRVEGNHNYNRLQSISQLSIPYKKFDFWLSHDVYNQVLSGTELVWQLPFNVDVILTPKKIFQVSAWCYPDFGSLSILIILKFKKTTTTCYNYSNECRFSMATLAFDLFYDVIWLNNEWNRSHLAIILQCWYDIDSQIKYSQSRVEVTPILALHRFPLIWKWKKLQIQALILDYVYATFNFNLFPGVI